MEKLGGRQVIAKLRSASEFGSQRQQLGLGETLQTRLAFRSLPEFSLMR